MGFRPLEITGRFSAPPDRTVSFDGTLYSARSGEPLAVSLLAHEVYVLSRSTKYHRPRGLFCARGSCGNCLAQVDGRPNERLCLTSVQDDHVVQAQNVLGSARHDLLASIDWLFRGGLDHHHMMTRSLALNRLAVRMARKLAGLGELPRDVRLQAVAKERRRLDVLVVGAGAAGRSAAAVTRAAGLETLLVEALPGASAGVEHDTAALGLYDDREHLLLRGDELLRVECRALVLATGAHDLPPPCPGNDLPGVFSARATERLLEYGVRPGRRVVVLDAGVPEAESLAKGLEARVVPLDKETIIEGGSRVEGLRQSAERHTCDAIVYAAPGAPAYELPRQLGLALRFDPERGFFPEHDAGRTGRRGVFLAGELAGSTRLEAAADGERVGQLVVRGLAR